MARVQFHVSKHELTGRPVIRAVVPRGANREDLARVQDYIFTTLPPDVGLDNCPGCISGFGGVTFEEEFEEVIHADLRLSVDAKQAP